MICEGIRTLDTRNDATTLKLCYLIRDCTIRIRIIGAEFIQIGSPCQLFSRIGDGHLSFQKRKFPNHPILHQFIFPNYINQMICEGIRTLDTRNDAYQLLSNNYRYYSGKSHACKDLRKCADMHIWKSIIHKNTERCSHTVILATDFTSLHRLKSRSAAQDAIRIHSKREQFLCRCCV